MQKRKIFVTASLIVGLIIFVIVLVQNFDIFLSLGKLNYIYLIPYLIVTFIIHSIHVLRWKLILHSHDKKFGFLRLLLYRTVGFSVSYFTPSAQIGGEPVRAWLLTRHNMRFHHSLSTVMIDKFMEVAINLMLGVIGVFFLILKFTVSDDAIVLMTAALFFAVLGVLIYYRRMVKNKPFFSLFFRFSKQKKIVKIRRTIQKSEKMVSHFFNRKKKILLASLMLTLVNFVVMFFEYYFLFLIFGVDAEIGNLFMVIAVVAISYIMPVPSGLGVMEFGQAGLFSFLSLKSSFGVGMSLIIRLRDSCIAVFGLIYLTFRGIKSLGLAKIKEKGKITQKQFS